MSRVVDPRTPVDPTNRMATELAAIKRRLDLLEAPTGTSVYQTVAKLTQLVSNIQAQLDAYNAARYTNAQIDARIASPGAIAPTTVTASGDVVVGGQLRAPDAVAFNITGARRTAWLEDATGRLGYSPSSERVKQDIAPAAIDVGAVLAIEPSSWRYREQVTEVGDAAAIEVGVMAEAVAAAGLEFAVLRNGDGEVEGVEYSQLVVALLAVVRELDRRINRVASGNVRL
ncbi:hypothetical protein GCM10027515_31860 [Schumannella luteola]|uniref:Peptidase S74 domain-containing protein n=1 Tax=Schumannella luteola TaxID=472059 RepID=A0A852Y9B2_9MICO|nr:tail fiber domain-containing protein [Schumannella luteola]NYG99013.1 hypothetical protein [Schumannella luteola]TPX06373.1 tail fiber domain-containing protein [Schumannella luteola]